MKYVKNEDQKLQFKTEIKERWIYCFDKLFNGDFTQDLRNLTTQCQGMVFNFMCRIKDYEMKETLQKTKSRKAIGPDVIPTKVWRYIGEISVR